jgi:putative hydrolase of the HAD superfamily
MAVNGINPVEFLDYVHDIDYSPVPPSPALAAAIAQLPGRRIIFTNGSRRHAECVADRLGITHLFDAIFDITDAAYVPKPREPAYRMFLAQHGVTPDAAAMFEDLPHNLEAAHGLGMTTVLVHAAQSDHPIYGEIRDWQRLPDHIHHMTDDLTAFLDRLNEARA